MCKCVDSDAQRIGEKVGADIEALDIVLEHVEGGRNVPAAADFGGDGGEAKRASGACHLGAIQHGGRIVGIDNDSQPPQAGHDFVQQFEPLGGDLRLLVGQTGDVSARSREARHQAVADRVARRRKDGWNGRKCPRRFAAENDGAGRDDDIDLHAHELSDGLSCAHAAAFRPAVLDVHRAALDPAEFAETLHEGRCPLRPGQLRRRAQEADGRHLRGLLRAGCKRPSSCAAEQRDELTPFQSLHEV